MSNTTPNKSIDPKPQMQARPTRPNEQGTISVQAHFKVFDPNTKQTFVEGRA